MVSNVVCEPGVVRVYDSSYTRESADTIRVIASLVYIIEPKLVVQMMDVQKGSDCGMFAIAYCYELCCGLDPCKAKFDCKMIREHLSLCLQNHCMSWFPGEQSWQ